VKIKYISFLELYLIISEYKKIRVAHMPEKFFYPKTIALIGATENPKKFGNAVTKNLVKSPHLSAEIFPINRSQNEIMGIQAYNSLYDVPRKIDLAIILVPAKVVPLIVDQCIDTAVKRIVIITAGFGEIDKEGKKIEQKIVKKCREAAIRVIGPNCVGIQNTENGMNASFIQEPLPGNISMVSQSGSFGCAIIDGMRWNNLGLSKFANIGNAADISFHEIVQYFGEDDDTKVISIYSEAIKEGQNFFHEIKEISPKKPIVVLKGGRTSAGMAAAGSHTGSLASNYRILSTAVRQAGGIMCENMEDYITALKSLSNLPIPQGLNIGVLTNSGGTGVLYSDNIEEQGLSLSKFSPRLIKSLEPHLIDLVQIVNPLDMIAGAAENSYYQVTKSMLAPDSGIDIVVPCGVFPPFLGQKFEHNFRGMVRAWNVSHRKKPMLPLLVFGNGYEKVVEFSKRENVPIFSTPHEAAYATRILIDRMKFLKLHKNS
jgi:acetate---CoA ligase (ADP-forming) subunit alpha